MGIKDKLYNFLGIKKEWKNKESLVNNTLLEVGINDELLVVTLGQWLGILPDAIKIGNKDSHYYNSLSATDFLKRYVLTKDQKRMICKRVAYLFELAGFGYDDICMLQNFDDEKLTFKACFTKYDDLDCEITWGHFLDACAQLRIRNGKEYYRFDYISGNEKKADNLNLEVYDKKLGNGNTFNRYASEYRYCGNLISDNNRLSVEIAYPDKLEVKDKNKYVDEIKMQSLISAFNFPIDIEYVCNTISNAILVDSCELPEIKISVKKTLDDGKTQDITDKVVFKNGEFNEFVITRDGRKIIIDQFDNWSINSKTHSVSGNSDVEVGFVINKLPKDQMLQYVDPVTIVDCAFIDYEETKKMALSLFKKEK